MTPLEAAARALCICAGDDPGRITNPQDRNRDAVVAQAVAVESWTNYRAEARAAISAYLKACSCDSETMLLVMRAMRDTVDSDHAEAWYEVEARAALSALEPKE